MDWFEHTQRYRALDVWFETPQGQRIAQAFADEIHCFNAHLRGESLLQLGQCASNPWLSSLHYQHKIIVSPCMNHSRNTLTSVFSQLPIDRDSIDCIIAPLTFEAFSFDKNPLDELDRVLKPSGHMIILGVNPCSIWGLLFKLQRLSLFGNSPTKLTSFFSVKRDLLSRDYLQCALTTFYYIPPVQNESSIHRLEFLNEMGKMLWLFPANFYCLVVQKQRIITPTPLVRSVEDRYLSCVDNSLA